MVFLDKTRIQELLPMEACISEMEKLFSLDLSSEIVNPLRSKMQLPDSQNGILGLMPAYIKPYEVMGVKVLSVFANNYLQGLSSHQGVLQLFETKTGTLLGCLDADEITAIRTASVSALMTNLLAVEDATTLCLLGSGKQAATHLEAMCLVRNISKVYIWSKNNANAHRFVSKMKAEYAIDFIVCDTVESAAKNADIICTVTTAKTPILSNNYLQEHVHINAVGACTPTQRELASDVVLNAEVFIDNYEAITNESGDVLIPSKEENIEVLDLIKADIHQVLKDKTLIDQRKKTVFDSVGIAMEDVAAGYYCLSKSGAFF